MNASGDTIRRLIQLCEQRRYLDAELYAEEVSHRDELGDDAVLQLAMVFYQHRRYQTAKEYITRIKEAKDPMIFNNMGVICYRLNLFSEALAYFGRALDLDSSYADALLNQARVYEKIGRYEQAISILEQVLASSPAQEQAQKGLKRCRQLNNQPRHESRERGQEGAGMNILIRQGGFENKGAEAMLRTVQQEVGKRIPGSRFFMEVQPGLRSFFENKDIELLSTSDGGRYRDIDALIDISGFALGDAWAGMVPFYEYHNSLFEAFGKPVIFLPQAFGAFLQDGVRKVAIKALNLCDFAYARDQRSHAYLLDLEGVPQEKIGLAPDIAFNFTPAPQKETDALLQEKGWKPGERPWIGIIPNMRVYERVEGQGAENRYVKLLLHVAKHFIEQLGCNVILMPHEIRFVVNEKIRDDRYLIGLLADYLGHPEHVLALTGQYSAEYLKAVVGRMHMVVGSRYHGIIAALSQYIPSVILGWSHKYNELAKEAGIERYVIDYTQLSEEGFLEIVQEAWEGREAIAKILKKTIPVLKEKSQVAIDHACKLIQDKAWA